MNRTGKQLFVKGKLKQLNKVLLLHDQCQDGLCAGDTLSWKPKRRCGKQRGPQYPFHTYLPKYTCYQVIKKKNKRYMYFGVPKKTKKKYTRNHPPFSYRFLRPTSAAVIPSSPHIVVPSPLPSLPPSTHHPPSTSVIISISFQVQYPLPCVQIQIEPSNNNAHDISLSSDKTMK